MKIEEATELKIKAENKIVDILNKLEKATNCKVDSIEFISVVDEGFGRESSIIVKQEVNIKLLV